MVVFGGIAGEILDVWMCSGWHGNKNKMALSELNVTVENLPLSSFWPAQIVEPEMTARDLPPLLLPPALLQGVSCHRQHKGVVGIIELESSVNIFGIEAGYG